MNKSIIVYGPQGCGKTVNAERIRKHFGLDRVVDDFTGSRAPYERNKFEVMGVLYLTFLDYDTLCQAMKIEPGTTRRILSFADVAKQINDAIPATKWHDAAKQLPPADRPGVYIATVTRRETFYRHWDGATFYYGCSNKDRAANMKEFPWPYSNMLHWRGLSEEPIIVQDA